eukprot:TRINITY_DN12495_c0_g1_i1.p1 TRINITY_DN12495_c0_g1~~TRINITY_DN12495_c0_g1_i1.p1  ORF type:complete len:186 (+),score=39.08 TRINITY_DN12495_c0_g1_i1:3-560(+)
MSKGAGPQGVRALYTKFASKLERWDKLHQTGDKRLKNLLKIREAHEEDPQNADMFQWEEYKMHFAEVIDQMESLTATTHVLVDKVRNCFKHADTIGALEQVCSRGASSCQVSHMDFYLFMMKQHTMLVQQVQLYHMIQLSVEKTPPPPVQSLSAFTAAWEARPFMDETVRSYIARALELDQACTS